MPVPVPTPGSTAAAAPNGAPPTPRELVAALAAKRSAIDDELSVQLDVLRSHGVDARTPLVDAQGFPRADVDLLAVRAARQRLAELRNDRSDVERQLAAAVEAALPRQEGASASAVQPAAGSAPAPAASSAAAAAPAPTSSQAAAAAAAAQADYAVGTSIPPQTAHAVSVSLPRWADNIDYEEGRLTDVMQTGYPRFFVHRKVQALAALLQSKFADPSSSESEAVLLLPTARCASRCRAFIIAQSRAQGLAAPPVRIVAYRIPASSVAGANACNAGAALDVHVVLFPNSSWGLAKAFWQHTGDGISSRFAVDALSRIEANSTPDPSRPSTSNGTPTGSAARSRNRHYARSAAAAPSAAVDEAAAQPAADSSAAGAAAVAGVEHETYVEERYARVLHASLGSLAKTALRRRIAGTLLADRSPSTAAGAAAPDVTEGETAPTVREGTGLGEDDVYLYPAGMSAIFHAHQAALRWRRHEFGLAEDEVDKAGKSISFGFSYVDTLKILQKWGAGALFFGNGTGADVEALEAHLRANSSEPAPVALFCEFPSNPLLRSPDLRRLRALADEFGFLLVVDETIGNFLNVEVLPLADIVVSSLTKVFSGETNVMGGSLVLNPHSRHIDALRSAMAEEYEDTYYGPDACVMERNSRDFATRVHRINRNAETLADFLRDEIGRGVVRDVYYPKFQTRELYDACRRRTALLPGVSSEQGGYGGLFSVTFSSAAAASAFYDALDVAKGPSLGTNFTLASPYAILAHYGELEWAAEFGVERNLVRVSTGLESEDALLATFARALLVASRAARAAR